MVNIGKKVIEFYNLNINLHNQDSVAGSVIQASGMVVVEDASRTAAWLPDYHSGASVRTSPGVNLAPLRGDLRASEAVQQADQLPTC